MALRAALVAVLALLLAPAGASACSLAATTTFLPASGAWDTAANWSAGLPDADAVACIPSAKEAIVTTFETTGGFEVDAGGKLTLNGGSLDLAPTLATTVSALAGELSVIANGTLTIGADTELDLVGSPNVTTTFVGPTPQGTVANFGRLIANPDTSVIFEPALNSAPTAFASVANGSLILQGGGNLDGPFDLDTGSPSTVLDLNGGNFTGGGVISDGGGLGELRVTGANIVWGGASEIHVDTIRMSAGTFDFSPSPLPSGAPSITASNVYITAGDMFVDLDFAPGRIEMSGGKLGGGGDFETSSFAWGGGDLEAPSAHSKKLAVDALDLSMAGSGLRVQTNRDLLVTGGTGGIPYDSGTWTLTSADVIIGPGGELAIGANDPGIDGTGGSEKILVHGTLNKVDGSGAPSIIDPPVSVPDGVLQVALSHTLELTLAPVEYAPNALNIAVNLDGTLTFPGTVDSIGTGSLTIGPQGHLINSVGAEDVLATLTSNPAGSDLTLSDTTLGPNGSFSNQGSLTLHGTAQINMVAGDSYTQLGGVTSLASATSQITTSGAGTTSVLGGTLGGIGIVNGNLDVEGTVAPGNSPGTLTVSGNYTQLATGTLLVEIGGIGAGQYDQMIVGGNATLDGTLVIENFGGYTPGPAIPFNYLTSFGTRSGTFSTITRPADGLWYSPSYTANGASVSANGVAVSGASVTEGNAGDTAMSFTIGLVQPETSTVSVDFAAVDAADAAPGFDYAPTGGTVSFAPGQTSKTVTVAVHGDTAFEGDETFRLNLSNPVGTRVFIGTATGTITNDDVVATTSAVPVSPGDIDGFPTAPPPVQGKAVNVEPVKGIVLVKLPGSKVFVKLPDREQVPVGTIIDTRKGTVRLFSAGKNGKVQAANFFEGVFQVLQKRGQALTDAKLFGASFKSCPKSSKASAAAKKGTKSVRHLWGDGSGQFRTVGRFAAATIRGTRWLTDDRCDGTLIRVTKGSVAVRDLTLKKTVVVKAPKRYLALAKKKRR